MPKEGDRPQKAWSTFSWEQKSSTSGRLLVRELINIFVPRRSLPKKKTCLQTSGRLSVWSKDVVSGRVRIKKASQPMNFGRLVFWRIPHNKKKLSRGLGRPTRPYPKIIIINSIKPTKISVLFLEPDLMYSFHNELVNLERPRFLQDGFSRRCKREAYY